LGFNSQCWNIENLATLSKTFQYLAQHILSKKTVMGGGPSKVAGVF
jgi:hypothetical protein